MKKLFYWFRAVRDTERDLNILYFDVGKLARHVSDLESENRILKAHVADLRAFAIKHAPDQFEDIPF